MIMTQTQHWPDYDRVLIVDLASNGRELAGTVQLELYKEEQHFGGTAFLHALWVDEKHRRYMVGSRLLLAAERVLKANGHPTCTLQWHSEESPQWVCDWYQRKGYEYTTFTPGVSALLRKDLTKRKPAGGRNPGNPI